VSQPSVICAECGQGVTVTPDGRGFPPDIARRKLAKLCRAAGHEPDLRYYAGFSYGPAPRGQS